MGQNLLEWSDDFNTGIKQVDGQHRKLVELLNRLHQAIQNRQSKEVSRQILDELTAYTKSHFKLEEGLMQASSYAAFPEHKQQHEALIAQIVALQVKLDSGQASIGFELLHFLKTWLTRHINETDKRFGAYFVLAGREEALAGAGREAEKPRWWKVW